MVRIEGFQPPLPPAGDSGPTPDQVNQVLIEVLDIFTNNVTYQPLPHSIPDFSQIKTDMKNFGFPQNVQDSLSQFEDGMNMYVSALNQSDIDGALRGYATMLSHFNNLNDTLSAMIPEDYDLDL